MKASPAKKHDNLSLKIARINPVQIILSKDKGDLFDNMICACFLY